LGDMRTDLPLDAPQRIYFTVTDRAGRDWHMLAFNRGEYEVLCAEARRHGDTTRLGPERFPSGSVAS
jgi:hypothetical protein